MTYSDFMLLGLLLLRLSYLNTFYMKSEQYRRFSMVEKVKVVFFYIWADSLHMGYSIMTKA